MPLSYELELSGAAPPDAAAPLVLALVLVLVEAAGEGGLQV